MAAVCVVCEQAGSEADSLVELGSARAHGGCGFDALTTLCRECREWGTADAPVVVRDGRWAHLACHADGEGVVTDRRPVVRERKEATMSSEMPDVPVMSANDAAAQFQRAVLGAGHAPGEAPADGPGPRIPKATPIDASMFANPAPNPDAASLNAQSGMGAAVNSWRPGAEEVQS